MVLRIIRNCLIWVGRVTTKIVLISLPSFFIAFIFLEVITRLILTASDSPKVAFNPTLGMIYKPSQNGKYIKGTEMKAIYKINNEGWNSTHNYKTDKASETLRVAVVGDSFVEAFQVDYDKSYPYVLENHLKESGIKSEIYSFGHSGSNLVHYLETLKYVDQHFKPDLYIVNIVDNDFKESFYGIARKDNWSVTLANTKIDQISPQESKNLLVKQIARTSAFIRYLTINLDVINNSKIANKIFYSDLKNYKQDVYRPDIHDMEIVVSWVLDEYKKASNSNLVLVLDANTKYQDPEYPAYRALITKLSREKQIDLIDLEGPFKHDQNPDDFIWKGDYHWTEKGHKLVADSLFNWMTTTKYLTNQH